MEKGTDESAARVWVEPREGKVVATKGFAIEEREIGEVLGIDVDRRGSTETSYRTALRKAKKKWAERYAVYTRGTTIKLRAQRYYMEVGGVLLYGAGGWTLTKEQARTLEAWEGWCWGEMLGYPPPTEEESPEEYKRKRYEKAREARSQQRLESLVGRYLSTHFRWMGHMARGSAGGAAATLLAYRCQEWWERTQPVGLSEDPKNREKWRHSGSNAGDARSRAKAQRMEALIYAKISNWREAAADREEWKNREAYWVSEQCRDWLGDKFTGETRKVRRSEKCAAEPTTYKASTRRVLSWEGPEIEICTSHKNIVRIGNGLSQPRDVRWNEITAAIETIRRSGARFGEQGVWRAVNKKREETKWHKEQARRISISEWKMEKGMGCSEIREAMGRGERPRVEMHLKTYRYQGKQKAWWIGFSIIYRDKNGEGHPLFREVGKIPVPEEHETKDFKMLSLSKAVPMLLVRFFQELFTI